LHRAANEDVGHPESRISITNHIETRQGRFGNSDEVGRGSEGRGSGTGYGDICPKPTYHVGAVLCHDADGTGTSCYLRSTVTRGFGEVASNHTGGEYLYRLFYVGRDDVASGIEPMGTRNDTRESYFMGGGFSHRDRDVYQNDPRKIQGTICNPSYHVDHGRGQEYYQEHDATDGRHDGEGEANGGITFRNNFRAADILRSNIAVKMKIFKFQPKDLKFQPKSKIPTKN